MKITDRALYENGHRLRPHIMWLGEEAPMMENAIQIILSADIVIIIGASLNIYPAPCLINRALIES